MNEPNDAQTWFDPNGAYLRRKSLQINVIHEWSKIIKRQCRHASPREPNKAISGPSRHDQKATRVKLYKSTSHEAKSLIKRHSYLTPSTGTSRHRDRASAEGGCIGAFKKCHLKGVTPARPAIGCLAGC